MPEPWGFCFAGSGETVPCHGTGVCTGFGAGIAALPQECATFSFETSKENAAPGKRKMFCVAKPAAPSGAAFFASIRELLVRTASGILFAFYRMRCRRHKLHIPRPARRAGLIRSAASPLPTEPASLGFGGDPIEPHNCVPAGRTAVQDSGGRCSLATPLSALSASLSAAGVKFCVYLLPPGGESKGEGPRPLPFESLGGVGETGEAPPVADGASLFRGSGTIGGHEQWPGIVMPRRWARVETPPRFWRGSGEVSLRQRHLP